MQINFWGVRGSIPSPASNVEIKGKLKRLLNAAIRSGVRNQSQFNKFWKQAPITDKITIGGNTACVEVREDKAFIILDAGSGMCPLGHHALTSGSDEYASPYHIYLTHYHWDHILGFPFFGPAYRKGNHVIIHSASPKAHRFFRVQQSVPFFPAGLEFMPAKITFTTVQPGASECLGPFVISTIRLFHPGNSLGYKIASRSGCVVYLTDTELLKASPKSCRKYQEFAAGADVAIVDSQYGMLESHLKAEWGHSTAFHWIDLMQDTGVRDLFLFHYEPLRSDEDIADLLKRSQDYLARLYPKSTMQIHAAYEGQRFKIVRRRR